MLLLQEKMRCDAYHVNGFLVSDFLYVYTAEKIPNKIRFVSEVYPLI